VVAGRRVRGRVVVAVTQRAVRLRLRTSVADSLAQDGAIEVVGLLLAEQGSTPQRRRLRPVGRQSSHWELTIESAFVRTGADLPAQGTAWTKDGPMSKSRAAGAGTQGGEQVPPGPYGLRQTRGRMRVPYQRLRTSSRDCQTNEPLCVGLLVGSVHRSTSVPLGHALTSSCFVRDARELIGPSCELRCSGVKHDDGVRVNQFVIDASTHLAPGNDAFLMKDCEVLRDVLLNGEQIFG
jgi:hypothetical protein